MGKGKCGGKEIDITGRSPLLIFSVGRCQLNLLERGKMIKQTKMTMGNCNQVKTGEFLTR